LAFWDGSRRWASQEWMDVHPAVGPNIAYGDRTPTFKGAIDRGSFEAMTDHIVSRYFSQPNYLRVQTKAGGPECAFFSIYELPTFVAGQGGVTQARAALDAFRAKAVAAGEKCMHISTQSGSADPAQAKALGLDSTANYCWCVPSLCFDDPTSTSTSTRSQTSIALPWATTPSLPAMNTPDNPPPQVSHDRECAQRTVQFPSGATCRDAQGECAGVARYDSKVGRRWVAVHSQPLGSVGLEPEDCALRRLPTRGESRGRTRIGVWVRVGRSVQW
jgi:hypothetical protein